MALFITFLVALLCLFCLGAYLIICFVAPEWLGITGSQAKKVQSEHRENKDEIPKRPNDFFSR